MTFLLGNLSLHIRKASIYDVEQMHKIESSSFGKHHWSKQSFLNEIKNPYSNYFVACLTKKINQVIGYIGYWKVNEEGHITTLAVDQFFRRKHVADILLYRTIQSAINERIKWLTLEVRVSNLPAISLYRKFNFKEIGIRKKYYQDNNEDGLILWTENILNETYINELKNKVISKIIKNNVSSDKLHYISSQEFT